MKIYIWKQIDEGLTSAWHSGGGLMIITDRPPQQVYDEIVETGKTMLIQFELPDPDVTYDVYSVGVKEDLILFPDVGCC